MGLDRIMYWDTHVMYYMGVSCNTWLTHVIHDMVMLYMTCSCNTCHTHIKHDLIMFYMSMSCITWVHYYMRTPCNTWHFSCIIWVWTGLRASKFAGCYGTCKSRRCISRTLGAIWNHYLLQQNHPPCKLPQRLTVVSAAPKHIQHTLHHSWHPTHWIGFWSTVPIQPSSPSKSSTSWVSNLHHVLGP